MNSEETVFSNVKTFEAMFFKEFGLRTDRNSKGRTSPETDCNEDQI